LILTFFGKAIIPQNTDSSVMTNVLAQIRADLKATTDNKTEEFSAFFKEQVKYYGVKTETVGKIAKKYWPRVKTLDKQDIFGLCEELYRSDYTEEAFIVAFWLPNYIDNLEPGDLATFKRWIELYINNWQNVMDSAATIGDCWKSIPNYFEIKVGLKARTAGLSGLQPCADCPSEKGCFK
jgi:3-methyladenine DNA glycosylase AlkD